MSEVEVIQCLNCRVGALRRLRAVYVRPFEDHLIVIPDAGAWQCDMCGEFVYDDDAILFAELLADGTPSSHALTQQQPPSGSAAAQPTPETDHRRV